MYLRHNLLCLPGNYEANSEQPVAGKIRQKAGEEVIV
jgi:hypothetical protein